MVDRANLICQSELLHQLVIDRDSMEELGRVELVWMYPAQHRVLGFVCKSGMLKAKRLAFNLPQIHRIGHNGILVKAGAVETEASKVRQLDSLLHCEVWSDAGEKLGKVTDYQFDLKTGAIHCYLFTVTGWKGLADGVYCLPPNSIRSYGKSRVLVNESVARNLQVYREGIRQKFDKAKTGIQQDYGRVTQEFKSLANQAQDTVGQVKNRWQDWTHAAHDRAQSFSETARQRSQDWTGQVRQRAQTWREQMQQQIQSLAEDPPIWRQEDDPPSPAPDQTGNSAGVPSEAYRSSAASTPDRDQAWDPETDPDWDWDEPTDNTIPTTPSATLGDEPKPWEDDSEPWEDWQETATAPAADQSEKQPTDQPVPQPENQPVVQPVVQPESQSENQPASETPSRTLIPPPPAAESPASDSSPAAEASPTPQPPSQAKAPEGDPNWDDDLDDDPWI